MLRPEFLWIRGLHSLIFYLPLFYQVVLMMTPAQAGAGLIPAAISAVVGTFLGGIILKRIGKYYWLAVTSALVAAVASVPVAIVPSLRSGSLITICIASVASFVPQGIVVTASLIAIRMLQARFCPGIADCRSVKCCSCRPGGCYCLLVPVPFAWRSNRRLSGWPGHRSSFGRETPSGTGSSRCGKDSRQN